MCLHTIVGSDCYTYVPPVVKEEKQNQPKKKAKTKYGFVGFLLLRFCFVQVGKADYENERQAPKGMEWKTWEGDKLPQKDDDDDA